MQKNISCYLLDISLKKVLSNPGIALKNLFQFSIYQKLVFILYINFIYKPLYSNLFYISLYYMLFNYSQCHMLLYIRNIFHLNCRNYYMLYSEFLSFWIQCVDIFRTFTNYIKSAQYNIFVIQAMNLQGGPYNKFLKVYYPNRMIC